MVVETASGAPSPAGSEATRTPRSSPWAACLAMAGPSSWVAWPFAHPDRLATRARRMTILERRLERAYISQDVRAAGQVLSADEAGYRL